MGKDKEESRSHRKRSSEDGEGDSSKRRKHHSRHRHHRHRSKHRSENNGKDETDKGDVAVAEDEEVALRGETERRDSGIAEEEEAALGGEPERRDSCTAVSLAVDDKEEGEIFEEEEAGIRAERNFSVDSEVESGEIKSDEAMEDVSSSKDLHEVSTIERKSLVSAVNGEQFGKEHGLSRDLNEGGHQENQSLNGSVEFVVERLLDARIENDNQISSLREKILLRTNYGDNFVGELGHLNKELRHSPDNYEEPNNKYQLKSLHDRKKRGSLPRYDTADDRNGKLRHLFSRENRQTIGSYDDDHARGFDAKGSNDDLKIMFDQGKGKNKSHADRIISNTHEEEVGRNQLRDKSWNRDTDGRKTPQASPDGETQRDLELFRDRDNERLRHGSWNKDDDRKREKIRDRDRPCSLERGRDNDRNTVRNKEKERDKERERESERNRQHSRDYDRNWDMEREKRREKYGADFREMRRDGDFESDMGISKYGSRDRENYNENDWRLERDEKRQRRHHSRDSRDRDHNRDHYRERESNRDRDRRLERDQVHTSRRDRRDSSDHRSVRESPADYRHGAIGRDERMSNGSRAKELSKDPIGTRTDSKRGKDILIREDDEEDYQERIAMQLAEEEEEDIEKIKEESRKRRQAILEKYKHPQLQKDDIFEDAAAVDGYKPGEIVGHDKFVATLKHQESPIGVEEKHDVQGASVSDQSISVRKSPLQNGTQNLKQPSPEGGLGDGSPKDEICGDMFCDDIFGDSPAGIRKQEKGDGINVQRNGLYDNWDDSEGYYSYRIGEVLDGRYEITSAHGKGVFSIVVRAKDLKAGKDDLEEIAIKIIRNNETMYKAGLEEVTILDKLVGADPEDKLHCVRFLSSFKYRNHLCLVFESLHMNLREVLKKFGRNIGLKLTAVRTYAKQLFIALKHLKNCGVLHSDIKPDNMLVNESKNVLKLCDFGNAMFAGKNEITPYLVSRFYRAPEIILGLSYDHAMDIWSVGCCLYELYTGKVLFPGPSNNDMLRLHMELKGPFPKKMLRKGAFTDHHFDQDFNFHATEEDPVTKKTVKRILTNIKQKDLSTLISSSLGEDTRMLANFKDLLDRIFVLDPEKRLTVSQALSHPFITGK